MSLWPTPTAKRHVPNPDAAAALYRVVERFVAMWTRYKLATTKAFPMLTEEHEFILDLAKDALKKAETPADPDPYGAIDALKAWDRLYAHEMVCAMAGWDDVDHEVENLLKREAIDKMLSALAKYNDQRDAQEGANP